MTALIATQFGDALNVIQVVDDAPGALVPHAIRVRLRYAPINPADLNLIAGTYGVKPDLPLACGLEGLAVVEAIGAAVNDFRVGDWVRPIDGVGAWRTHATAPAARFHHVPQVRDAEQAAMIAVNPATAWRLLQDAGKDHETILINGGSTNLGRCLIQIGVALGKRIIATVRHAERRAELIALGATAVVVDDRQTVAAIRALGATIRVAINQIGGESAANQLKILAEGGHQITVGGLSLQPITLGAGALIFRDIHASGFWITRWYRHAPVSERNAMFSALATLIDAGKLQQPIAARFPLKQWKDAIRAAQAPRTGKILFDCSDSASYQA